MEHIPYSIFTMYSVLFLGFLFWFVITYTNCMCKSLEIYFLEILGAPRKKQVLILSWCTLCIAFWNYKASWFLIAYFNLSLAIHIPYEKFFLSGNVGAPLKNQQYCSFHRSLCIYHFQSRKCLESCLFIFIWH